MTEFYTRAKESADRMLRSKGQAVTITKRTAGAYDPATGGATVTTTTETGTGAVFEYGNKNIDGSLIKVGDKQLLLSAFRAAGGALTAPVVNDTVTLASGTVYTITQVKALSPGGMDVLYDCNLRGAV